jgi:competence protein ComEA
MTAPAASLAPPVDAPTPAGVEFESRPPGAETARGRRHRARADRAAAGPAGHVVVYVAGEVVHRGVYTLPASARAVDALAMAGGAAPDADLVAVNLAAPLTDGEEIAVPPKGAVFSPPRAERRASGTSRRRSSKLGRRSRRARVALGSDDASGGHGSEDVPAQLVDLNVADENELETLPGIGPALAGRIVEFRETNGPFSSLDDLLDVGGMTQRKLDEIEPYAVLH